MRVFSSNKGASGSEYLFLSSLVGVLAVAMMVNFGAENAEVFSTADGELRQVILAEESAPVQPLAAQPLAAAEEEPVISPVMSRVLAAGRRMAPGTAPECYDPINIGSVGDPSWSGCANMLIVDNSLIRSAGSSAVGGNQSASLLGPDGNQYSFANSGFNVFTGQVTTFFRLFRNMRDFNDDIS